MLDPETGPGSVILKAEGITKSFPGVKALNKVSLEVRKGEVLALLGENGAGKSTLIKILSGVYSQDEGSIFLDGNPVRFASPAEAKLAGIGIIHQELNYVATVSVAENIFMGDIPRRGIRVDYPKMYRQAAEIMDRIGLKVDPKKLIGQCTVAEKQLIEIARVVSHQVRILIMDEPTSALNDVETEKLFSFIGQARQMGLSIIYISHKLSEIFRLSHMIVVLRDGAVTGRFETAVTSREQLVSAMVGRALDEMYIKQPSNPADTALEVKNLSNSALKDVSFTARKGEILGVYGLMGSGHQDLAPAIVGQTLLEAGEIRVNGQKADIRNPHDAIALGIVYVPAERKTEGLVLNNTVRANILSSFYARHRKKRLINNRFELQVARRWVDALRIKTPSTETNCESLSGGNQQKVVIAKYLEIQPDILLLNEPTRGIDVGAKAEIYRILDDLMARQKCVIMITSEMPELLAMSDQILVFHEGRVSGQLSAENATQEAVLQYAIGG